jgi:hypothetical protein
LPFSWLTVTMGSKPGARSTSTRTTAGEADCWLMRMARILALRTAIGVEAMGKRASRRSMINRSGFDSRWVRTVTAPSRPMEICRRPSS